MFDICWYTCAGGFNPGYKRRKWKIFLENHISPNLRFKPYSTKCILITVFRKHSIPGNWQRNFRLPSASCVYCSVRGQGNRKCVTIVLTEELQPQTDFSPSSPPLWCRLLISRRIFSRTNYAFLESILFSLCSIIRSIRPPLATASNWQNQKVYKFISERLEIAHYRHGLKHWKWFIVYDKTALMKPSIVRRIKEKKEIYVYHFVPNELSWRE